MSSIIATVSGEPHQYRARVVEDPVVVDDETGDFAARVDLEELWRVLLVGLDERMLCQLRWREFDFRKR